MALTGLRQGTAHLKASSGGAGRFTPFISWKDGDAKTIAFLTPLEEIPKIRIHNFVKVPADNERGFNWETFMCRKDPAWLNESGGECYLCDVVGHKAAEKHVAIAVELDVSMKPGTALVNSLDVRTRSYKREDGTEVDYPQWGLVIQGFKNFFNYFTAFGQKYGGINDVAFDVTRVGGDTQTTYPVVALLGTELPDISVYADQIPSLLEVLEKMGSKEKYETELIGAEKIEQTEFEVDNALGTSGDEVRSMFDQLKSSLPGSGSVEAYE